VIRASAWLALALSVISPWAQALEYGSPAPRLSAPGRDGQLLTLEQFRGQVAYVDFWASWCAPCREEMPALDVLYRRYRSRGFVVLGVNVDTEHLPAQRMLEKFAPVFPVVFDPKGEWPKAFGLSTMPSAYLIDAKGVIRYVKTGYRMQDLPQLEAIIKNALGDQP
jgi:peroxiredoxin